MEPWANNNEVICLENTNTEALLSSLLDLDEFDKVILKYLVEYPGLKISKISKILGAPENTIRYRTKKPAFRLAQQRLLESTDDIMMVAAKKASLKLIELIDNPNPMISLGAVKIALHRFLNKKIENEEELVEYKVSIAADGQLLQSVIMNELEKKNTIDV